MNLNRILTAILAIFVLLAPAAAPAQQSVTRIVAVVGDDVITSTDLDRMIRMMEQTLDASNPASANDPDRPQKLKRVALERLIEDKILDQEAKRQKIGVGKAELDGYIVRLKKANRLNDDDFAAHLSRQGITPEEYRNNLRSEMLKHKLVRNQVQDQVVVSDEQVNRYYQEHRAEFGSKEQVRFRALFLKVPSTASSSQMEREAARIKSWRQEAEAKNNMADLAMKHSQGPGAGRGGELGPLSLADMLPAMRDALSGLEPGQFSQVVEVPGSLVFMQLLERSGGEGKLSESDREKIRKVLEKQFLEEKYREWIKSLRERSYVEIIKE